MKIAQAVKNADVNKRNIPVFWISQTFPYPTTALNCFIKMPFDVIMVEYSNTLFLCEKINDNDISVRTYFSDNDGKIRNHYIKLEIYATDSGSISDKGYGLFIPNSMKEVPPDTHKEAGILAGILCSCLTFINCRNIEKKLVHQCSPEVNRRRVREGKKELISYYVMNIRGSANNSAQHGLPESHYREHLCRGHFKRRKSGVYWWNPQVRGRKELGKIIKDYKL